jgi:DNA polymerase III epsilon subunit-like protein
MSEMTTKIEWKVLCAKCRKNHVQNLLPKVRRYLREHPKVSVRRVARFYGIPHSTLHDALNRKEEADKL